MGPPADDPELVPHNGARRIVGGRSHRHPGRPAIARYIVDVKIGYPVGAGAAPGDTDLATDHTRGHVELGLR